MKKNVFAKIVLIAAAGFAVNAFAAPNPALAAFQVKMKILKSCSVIAGVSSDIVLGGVAGVDSSATNTTASNTISVTCAMGTPYNINLKLASNSANTAGAGEMSGTGSNTDKVPYQLNSGSATGPIWGSTATGSAVATVGNGVHGTGTGVAIAHTVYATAPSANFTPDDYADTVTVNVLY